MIQIIEGSGVFIYPLGLCSILGIFVIFERGISLRLENILPKALVDKVIAGQIDDPHTSESVLSRILDFFNHRSQQVDKIRAFTNLEVNRMERGLVILEIVTGAAPLLGLLGTVTGLVQVFAGTSIETGIPDQTAFITGVALALTTTMIGLTVAIPSLVAYNIFQRRIDTYTVQLDAMIERLHSLSQPNTKL
ncbi:MAG: MotA/TolQ/ExbB proton channel family protein [Verrucomicrobia bacterium]|nr:MotA/TolQ/ExbB proton channel family protein [Verrucomicrobiota bacterium]MDA1065112.1 MotA/TolQ/ExbB proton channel family protein [Verrucomicrobiota bacterium]